ncbi:type VI secretion system baseplate subunit TssE [Chitiniphilus purpureus]|uniref:Type VI secretion system baseplate subunit TssE n=1 Tax=Chitiniphilus purpureus TaxID=2981137 RepID=A0ABY6DM65_9NEIS|nr:type VI secretion system baseplate subunit TssE [Chitiniphilus sp. CD1]UXY14576.1 type VI secretion system baseplate subunit TssE [Chitiniphilus sp. CD1]
MSQLRRQPLTQPSILDRLLDDAPENQQARQSYAELNDFKGALARDLEALLNTRIVEHEELMAPYPLSANSVINFGIPDLSGLSLLNPDDRELLRERVRRAIEHHEPRLTRVRITLDLPRETERLLRFRVDAVLKVHPHRPPVSFDATLQLSSNVYKIKGER